MKKLILTPLIALLLAGSSILTAQTNQEEFLGLPGDNLNLFAVMNLFRDSETLEDFERGLNDPNRMINNLDLNSDNQVDYLMVFDYVEGNAHSIVIRVALNRDEFQDVAVFTVEKLRNGSVQIQLVGDEALYGPNYIVEPQYAERPNPGYRGNTPAPRTRDVAVVRTTYYEIANWPVIVYMRRPDYRPWRSVWYWGYRPVWWNPWTPHYWHFYYGYHYNWHVHYHTYFRPCREFRSVSYHTVYHTRIRTYSPTVIVNVNNGHYRNTYSRPEKRREGEVFYSERHPSRDNNNPARNNSGRAEGRYRGTPPREVRSAPVNGESANESRKTEGRNNGRVESIENANGEQQRGVERIENSDRENRGRVSSDEGVRSGNNNSRAFEREPNVARESNNRRSNEGTEGNSPDRVRREERINQPRRETRTTGVQNNNSPARANERTVPRQEERQVAPAAPARQNQAPARTSPPANVERRRNEVRPNPGNNSNRSTTQPERVERSQPERTERSQPVRNESTQPARVERPQPEHTERSQPVRTESAPPAREERSQPERSESRQAPEVRSSGRESNNPASEPAQRDNDSNNNNRRERPGDSYDR